MKKQIKLHCFHCNKEFLRNISERKQALKRGNKPYCSKECSVIATSTAITVKCKHCNKRIKRTPSQIKKSKQFFCSHKCAAYITKNSKYIDGNSIYRKLAFNNYKHKCNNCAYNIIEALQVHHIDNNRQNNELNNLIILCANCHILTHKLLL